MHEHLRRTLEGAEPAEADRRAGPDDAAEAPTALHARDLRGANARDGGPLAQRIEVMLAGGLSDADALVALLEGSDPEARRAVAADAALVDRVVQACPVDRLPAVLAALVEDRKWALYHYACRRGGRDPDAVRGLLAGATLAQQLEIVRWAELVGRLGALAGGHPDSLFGAAVSARVDTELAAGSDPGRYRDFLAWREGGVFDPAAALAEMARSPEALAAAIAGQPSRWSRFLTHSPRGAQLGATERGLLDRVALSGGLDAERLRAAFAVRFGQGLDAPGLDAEGIRAVWARLAPLDPARVDRHTVERACLDPGGGAEGWQVAAFVDETTRDVGPAEGADEKKVQPEAEPPSPAEQAAAEREALLDAFVEACGGDTALRAAAEAFLMHESDAAGWRAAVTAAERRGALRVPAAEVLAALDRLRGEALPPLRVAGLGGRSDRTGPESPRRSGALPGWVDRLAPGGGD